MREYELLEGMRRSDGLTQKKLLRAIYEYGQDHIQNSDISDTWSGFMRDVAELKSHINKSPLKAYRGIELELSDEELEKYADTDYHSGFNAHEDDHCPSDLAQMYADKIDFSRVGTSWTWNRHCAVVGGKLDYNGNYAHVILEAEVLSPQIDLLVTMWQNLTVYQEECEVRLFANSPIRVTGMTPYGSNLAFPVRANTGPESWDTRDKVMGELFGYLRAA